MADWKQAPTPEQQPAQRASGGNDARDGDCGSQRRNPLTIVVGRSTDKGWHLSPPVRLVFMALD
jgi:hypothetical protein